MRSLDPRIEAVQGPPRRSRLGRLGRSKRSSRKLRGAPVPRQVDAVDAQMAFLVVMWGTAFSAIRALGEVLDPYQMTWFRYAPFLAFFGVWLVVRRRRRFLEVTGADWLRLTAGGILGVLGYHLPLNWGLAADAAQEVTGATGAILVATTPLWVLVIAVLSRQERFDGRKALGSGVAFLGVLVIVLLGRDGQLSLNPRSAVIVIAPVSWATYSIVCKPLTNRYGGLFVTGVTMCLGTLMLLPLGLDYGVEPIRRMDAGLLAWLAFLSIGSTVLGYALWNHALKHRSATEVTAFIYVIPLVATAAGWLILDERVTAWFLLGAALVLGGVVWIQRARLRPRQAAAVHP